MAFFSFEIMVKGHPRSLKMVPFESLGAVRLRNCGGILYCLQDIASYWSKMAKFLCPTCIFSTSKGVIPPDLREDFDIHKTRMIGLPCDEKTMTTC